MKLLFKFELLFLIFLLSGCGTSKENATSYPVEEPLLESYDDGLFFCQYDKMHLQTFVFDELEDFDYFLLITNANNDLADSFSNSYVYIATIKLNFMNIFNTSPLDFTRGLFNTLLNPPSDVVPSISQNSSGLYEYSYTTSDLTCKGKLINVNVDSCSLVIYNILNNESPDIIHAFNTCYESIEQSKFVAPTEITEGILYESIINIYPNISLYEENDTLNIHINLEHESYENDSFNFFNILISICQSCKLENNYSSISFIMKVDDELITVFPLLDYIDPDNFTTSEPIVTIDEYKEPISNQYFALLSSHDIGLEFQKKLDSIYEEYGFSD